MATWFWIRAWRLWPIKDLRFIGIAPEIPGLRGWQRTHWEHNTLSYTKRFYRKFLMRSEPKSKGKRVIWQLNSISICSHLTNVFSQRIFGKSLFMCLLCSPCTSCRTVTIAIARWYATIWDKIAQFLCVSVRRADLESRFSDENALCAQSFLH